MVTGLTGNQLIPNCYLFVITYFSGAKEMLYVYDPVRQKTTHSCMFDTEHDLINTH